MKHGKKLLLTALLCLLMIFFTACAQTEDSPDAGSGNQREQITVSEEQAENTLPEETAVSPNADDPTKELLPPTGKSDGKAEPFSDPEKEKQIEPAERPESEEAASPHCTISIRCDTILSNLELLDAEKAGIVPENGVLMRPRKVEFTQGESVFDVLLRETRSSKLHMEYTDTPAYGSAYIEGIGNLYEFDCGDLSGWMYRVNGWFPNYGCSQYTVSDGDVIEWLYTCDLGADLGAGQAAGK